ncbi:MAG: DNA-3-methyladenine glycosylase [Gammaproteobacteria bacterium]|nr:DNA-3-methyladenine glycosylase [Gammaproteobacteria bacterium]NIR84107.1 DNA-3-methyladenine glycosylase [Gammaproteobacteria bacterium]NIR89405.1 DNA-3-methyladenine glycosylase [Gammaproteobacteria bacterium]NIU07126.1 DNA-3-methyladenine glycosylase [Gammaproteobacteria bacterium]NIV74630.1 DNA-3-methyladenine glycosylase [Gammaproteobacteria bacterium]
MPSKLLPRSFYARDALEVARDLLGMRLHRDGVVLRITEVEAYRWPDDTANHGRFGRTARNDALWGPPGRAYVYTCYGVHHLLNLVTGRDGEATAVLVRSCEPLQGLEAVQGRRAGRKGPVLLTGPGKVGAALALDTSWCHAPLYTGGGLEVRAGELPDAILIGPRIGVGYAQRAHRTAPWRLAAAGTPWVSHRGALRPERRRRPS